MRGPALVILAAFVVGACSGTGAEAPESPSAPTAQVSDSAQAPPTSAQRDVAQPPERTADVYVPADHDPAEPAPLVVLLHGYSSTGEEIERYVGLQPLADERGFLYVHPDGSPDDQANLFWDATDACCNFTGQSVDDSAYLAGVIDEVAADYAVDPKRIYVVGHSNGGFMAYRMACEHADTVAAVVSIAGATFADPALCDPSEPVSVLQVHGDADTVISYTGGSLVGPYPAATDSVATWAGYDRCGGSPTPGAAPLDLEAALPGPESTVLTHPGCPAGVAVELWTIAGGGHIPSLSPTFASSVVDFLYAHPKP